MSRTLWSVFYKLEFWFQRKPDGFYKFLQPCKHPHYRRGDSWCEELNITEKTFRKYLKELCASHPSKDAFEKASDPFSGKPFASYYDHLHKKTFYFKSAQNFACFMKIFFSSKKAPKTKLLKDSEPNSESVHIYNNKNIFNNPPKSPMQSIQIKKGSGKIKNLKVKKKEEGRGVISHEARQMHKIWVEETKGQVKTPNLSMKFASQLLEALKKFFNDSLERWRAYCRRIASSNFLMGKVSKFQAWLVWVIKPEVFKKIESGMYGVDASINIGPTHTELKQADQQSKQQTQQTIQALPESTQAKGLRTILLDKIGWRAYLSWFSRIKIREKEGQGLELIFRNSFSATQVEQRFRSEIERISKYIWGETLNQISFSALPRAVG